MTRSRSSATATDGRLLRSERSRERIADALYELIGEGDLAPSAQRVADRAGVGIRTVFRLFDDMDALYATINERLDRDVAPLLRSDPTREASLDERLDAMLARRARLYERVGPYMRATHHHRDRSAFLAAQSRTLVRELRERLVRWFPELRQAPAELVDALDLATSFEAWDRLRVDQGLSRSRAQAAMQLTTRALLAQLEETR